jgi:hypothetical protein
MPDNSSLPLVVAAGGDPGGATALAPVLELLLGAGRVRLDVRAYRQACAIWRKRGIPFSELDEQAPISLPDETQVVLTSTSLNGLDLEKRFVFAARGQQVPAVSVIDFWSNYRRRFSIVEETLDCLPDRIAVMDSLAQSEMIAEGFDERKLIITGQPAFDDLATWRPAFTPEHRQAIRHQFGVNGDALLVVFASQPYSAFLAANASFPRYRGFNEKSVAQQLLRALERVAEECGRHITLIIRTHPREDVKGFDDLRSDRVRIQVTAIGDARETVAAADLVVGMNTVLLIEACYLGCLVVSLQPNLNGSDPLPTNRLGFSRAVYSEDKIEPTIREMLLDDGVRRRLGEKLREFQVDGSAARRVEEIVYSLLHTQVAASRS